MKKKLRGKTLGLLVASMAAFGVEAQVSDTNQKPDASKLAAEAVKFGYKGDDALVNTNLNYIITAQAVTNWVPERVLSVVEKYDFSKDELKVISDLSVLTPGANYKTLPEGYTKETVEPWFVYWTKPVNAMGLTGVSGILTHFNEDKNTWESSESYFSSYWNTEAEARKALDIIKSKLAAGYGVKKFHKFGEGWVAEYVRLCVMGVVGQKADGKWSCMIDLRDKCNFGCGPWESVAEQQRRLNRYIYDKQMKVWRSAVNDIASKNHEKVLALMQSKNLPGYSEAQGPDMMQTGCYTYVVYGQNVSTNIAVKIPDALNTAWVEQLQGVKNALGTSFSGDPETQEEEGGYKWNGATWSDDLFDVRLDVVVALRDMPAEQQEAKDDVEPAMIKVLVTQWRVVYTEKLQEGFVIPKKPELKK